MSSIAGTETGWDDGHLPAVEYAMWLLWSGLSSECPSQQLGKRTCSRRDVRRPPGQVGTVLDGFTPPSIPQFQYVTRRSCGVVAVELPAIMRSPFGNVCTPASVPRR